MFWTFYQALNFCDITKQERIPPGEAFPSDWVEIGSSRSTRSTIVFVSFSMATSQVSDVFFIIFDPLA